MNITREDYIPRIGPEHARATLLVGYLATRAALRRARNRHRCQLLRAAERLARGAHRV